MSSVGKRELGENQILKWCNTCSRTFNCKWPDEAVCENWAPDMYAAAAIANGAEVIEQVQEQETSDVD